MVLPHCSSLETLASVATARKPSRIHPGSSDMFANVPLEGTHSFSAASDCPSRNGKGRPRNASIQEAHCQRAKPNVSNLTITGHSRSPSDVGGVAMAEDSKIDANGITDEGPSCSYTAGCSTGSPLRKVVSHIFGRNKLCTRQIPKGVWVHYCRKHYQRSRYRNPSGFALLQCDLVRKQIDRLDTWGGVSDWVIKVRKREELRLNKENAELAAGRTAEDAASDGDETTEMASDEMQSTPTRRSGDVCTPVESHPSNPRRTSAATVSLSSSRWLIKFTGSGKTTEEVLEVLDNIESEIRDTRCNFPDIEILPNVSTPSHGTGSDHQRSLSSWSSSSLSSSAYPDDNGDHYEPQGSKRTSTLPCERAYPVGNSSKRRTLQRGLRPSSSEQDDE
ncbi:hypothetical protein MMC16_001997 [Acarospora aff. strigata]|nr:hypothetical protein [Acarospora aff. strigata]